MKLFICGDICIKDLARPYFENADAKGAFCDVLDIFKKADRVIVNLECAITESENAIKKCGGAEETIIRADITADGETFEKRCLIRVKKVAHTPKNYPRNFSQISKKPL